MVIDTKSISYSSVVECTHLCEFSQCAVILQDQNFVFTFHNVFHIFCVIFCDVFLLTPILFQYFFFKNNAIRVVISEVCNQKMFALVSPFMM